MGESRPDHTGCVHGSALAELIWRRNPLEKNKYLPSSREDAR
jgi:hypothetical protein